MVKLFANLTRSELMSRIRGKGNKTTELKLIGIFKAAKLRGWRRNQGLLGRPDFVFSSPRIALFVDGCYWHGCPIHFKQPSTNTAYWTKKISKNKARDRKVSRALRANGWTVIRIWEHSLKQANRQRLLRRLRRLIRPTY